MNDAIPEETQEDVSDIKKGRYDDQRSEITERLSKARNEELGNTEEPEEEIQEEEIQEPEYVTLKVDGEEIQVELEKVLDAGRRTLQKESSADKRLEEATRLLREAQEYSPVDNQQEYSSSSDPDMSELVRAIQYGDESEAANALKLIMGRTPATPQADPVQTTMEAIAFNDAVKTFQSKYPDIWKDPFLRKMSIEKEAELRQQGDNRPYVDVYMDVGEQVTKWVNDIRGSTTGDLEEKKNRKLQKDSISGGRAPASGDTKTPQRLTTSDVIANMRKARGQI